MYKIMKLGVILRTSDNAAIPTDPTNTDYQQYLLWLSEGNTPEPVGPALPTIPTVISMAQARLALLNSGLLDAVERGISSMGKATQIDWEYRHTVERESLLVKTFSESLGISSKDLDALFLAGSKL